MSHLLAHVTQAHEQLQTARETYTRAILLARREHSLREVADAAGVARTTIAKIVRRHRARQVDQPPAK